MSDSQEEIRVLNSKLEQLEKSKSCHQELVSIENELKQANDNLEKEALAKENNILKEKVKDMEKNKNKRMNLLKHLEDLSKLRDCEVENLGKTVANIKTKSSPRCRYGWKCKQLFCTFDNSYLHRKIHRNVTEVKLDRICETNLEEHQQSKHAKDVGTVDRCYPCAKFGNVFKTNSSLRRHRKHHHKEGNKSMNGFARNVDEASPKC